MILVPKPLPCCASFIVKACRVRRLPSCHRSLCTSRQTTRIAGFAIAGGLLGVAFAILLTVWTSRRVGLVTGGMPIVSPWAFGIIVFELAALGAILVTLARMIFEARLGRRAAFGYDDRVSQGKVVLSIEYDLANKSSVDECLTRSKTG